ESPSFRFGKSKNFGRKNPFFAIPTIQLGGFETERAPRQGMSDQDGSGSERRRPEARKQEA
ncbi:MAG: hypothetical protein J6X95_07830, partial [Treponema sp.]|nr:hypothetical protein [Treponema sp.]